LKEELKKAKEELAYEKSNGKEELVYLKEELKKSKDELVREKTRREEEVFVLTGEIQKSSRELEKGSCKGVCMVPEEIKKNYIERDLLSNKIREYISQDSRVPMLLSMAGLSSSILQGDIVGKLLNI
jgi:archaellum component FlaD/FlaE